MNYNYQKGPKMLENFVKLKNSSLDLGHVKVQLLEAKRNFQLPKLLGCVWGSSSILEADSNK